MKKCSLANCPAEIETVDGLCVSHDARCAKDFARRFPLGGDSVQVESWRATWMQMVDAELLNAKSAAPEPSKGYSNYASRPVNLPESATKAGQAALDKRAKEQNKLEAQLALDVADYARGRRMELELELKTKRAVAARTERNGVK